MTKWILMVLVLGILMGIFFMPASFVDALDTLISAGLMVVLFLVGIGVGRQKGLFSHLRRLGPRILLVPLMAALGSVCGAILAGVLILRMPWYQAGAVGAGFGWYSFVGVELTRHSAYLGTLAFITNITREMAALVLIPLVVKTLGGLEAAGMSGASAMSIALPVISRETDANITIIAFISGMTLALLVPLVVPLIMRWGG